MVEKTSNSSQESNETQNLSDNIEEEELELSLNIFSNFVNPHILRSGVVIALVKGRCR